MKPGNGSGNDSHTYGPGAKVGNEVPRFSDARPQPGQIEAPEASRPGLTAARTARDWLAEHRQVREFVEAQSPPTP